MVKSFVQYIEITQPAIGNNTADVERVKSALKIEGVYFPTNLANSLPSKLRRWNHKAKVVLFKNSIGWQVADILPPDKNKALFGVAVDLGTTRIVIRLINLETAESAERLDLITLRKKLHLIY